MLEGTGNRHVSLELEDEKGPAGVKTVRKAFRAKGTVGAEVLRKERAQRNNDGAAS